MCGIAGFSGIFQEALLAAMNQAIAHRGPDDAGIYYNHEKGVGLAHCRLSIIDLSDGGHQPMWDSTAHAIMVFNGEIYNYRELRKELLQQGYAFKSNSDTEVLLNLYLRDGVNLLDKLNGIFAFAIYDLQHDTLFLARDGVGVKPLYYAETTDGFLFASEMKALLRSDSIDREIDAQALLCHLVYLWSPAPKTLIKGVKKLEPGCALIVKNGRIKRYWRFYDLPYDQEICPLSEEEAIAQLRCCLSDAVKRQMIADVSVGAFLSGGLDSSAVVALARGIERDQDLPCFTIGFTDNAAQEEGMTEDLPYAKKVAHHLGVDLHTIYVGPEMAGELEKMIYHLDEPQADPAPINALFISRLAREHGIKVLLSGAGGDDLFTGYRRHFALMQEPYWKWMPGVVRKGIGMLASTIPIQRTAARRMAKAFQYAGLSGDSRMISYFNWINPERAESLLSDTIRKCLPEDSCEGPLLRSLSRLPSDVPELNRMLYLEGKHFLADHNLNYTDKMSMAYGVEVRVPLLDTEVIAFATRLPIRFKQRGRIGKWILKKAMEPYLPHDVIYRPKTGFGAPLRRWMKHELRPLVNDVLSSDTLRRRGLFNEIQVKRLIEMDGAGRIDGTYTIFSLICIELWCRMFLDARGHFNA
jgi:asparagine synthase (glutamine-hydrolysing)